MGSSVFGLTVGVGSVSAEPPNRYIVGTSSKDAAAAAERRADSVHRVLKFGGIGDAVAGVFPEEARKGLRKRPDVRYIEADGTMHAIRIDSADPEVPWGIDRVDAEQAHGVGETGQGADIAILDTGIDSNHTDLEANLGTGVAFVSVRGSYAEPWDDDNGHGTHCAGIADAVEDGDGVVGVSTEATLHAVKVLDHGGNGYYSDVAAGLQWVADQGYDVGSMSFSGPKSNTIEDACQYAYDGGVLLVAAAGNDSSDVEDSAPATYSTVMAISATDDTDSFASFSNFGTDIDLAAPGVDIYSTYAGGGYEVLSGTSMACPHVAGAGGQVMALGAGRTEARKQLTETGEDIGLSSRQQGAGLLDVGAAVGKHTITIESADGSHVGYEFEVERNLEKSTANGASIDSNDVIDESTASGSVVGGRDSYTYTGELIRFAADGELNVLLDGNGVDPANLVSEHTLTIESADGSRVNYDVEVENDLAKSEALGASIHSNDEVDGSVASGNVVGGRDSYRYSGRLIRWADDGEVTVWLDGEQIDPSTLVTEHTITIESADGSRVDYQFSAESNVSKSMALGASLDSGDTISGNTATGFVVEGRDSYTYSGEISSWTDEGDLTVLLDGGQISP